MWLRWSASVVLCLTFATTAFPSWTPLKKGLDYRATPETPMHLFRVDLMRYALVPFVRPQTDPVKAVATDERAALVVNANFFDPAKKPLGLVIQRQRVLNPLRSISWWGVFSITQHAATISPLQEFVHTPDIESAVQAGPRLIENHRIVPKLKPQSAARTFLCIEDAQHVVIGVSQHPIATDTLTRFLQEELHCDSALNLDGGSSTQVYAKIGKFELDLASPVGVPVTLAVVEK